MMTKGIFAGGCIDKTVSESELKWGGIPVIVKDNAPDNIFNMPQPNDDPEQQPVFIVTQSMVDWVMSNFEQHEPSLEYMVRQWRLEKDRFMKAQADEGSS